MKKVFLILAFMLSLFSLSERESWFIAQAEEIVSSSGPDKEQSATLDLSTLIAKLPCLNQAILYSIEENKTKYAMSFTVVSFFNDKINLDAMYVPSSEIGALVSFKLFNLGKWVKFPLLEYIEFQPFVYAGLYNIGSGNDMASSDIDYGAGAKIISIKF